jgi:hypothetical protein
MIWIASTAQPVRGLAEVRPYVRMERIPVSVMARLFEMSYRAYRAGGNEVLFYLTPDPWRIMVPEQVQNSVTVRPVDPYAGGADTLVEAHSHHEMRAFFSKTDDADERAGFRAFIVLGNLVSRPTVLARIGIYGHFYQVPACWVCDLPAGARDGLSKYDDVYDDLEEVNDGYDGF